MARLSDQEFLRYNRHVMVDKIGEEGQIKLASAHVLIIGLGGLGCPASQYLAASGVGRLSLMDNDHIELSNLQRQILFTQQDIGKAKVEIAKQRLEAINPLIQIDALPVSVLKANIQALLRSVTLVLDCTDSAETRHFINRACIQAKVKLVSASAIQGQGQVIGFDFSTTDSPCYACLFPETAETARNCATSGVLSPLLGVMGSLQATEAIKLLMGKTEGLNRLTSFDAWGLNFKQFNISKNGNCRACNRAHLTK